MGGRQSGVSPWCTRTRRRPQESLRKQVRARHPGRGALLLADRVGEVVRGRAARLSARSHPSGRPGPGHGHPRARSQVVEILSEIRRLTFRPRKCENAEDSPSIGLMVSPFGDPQRDFRVRSHSACLSPARRGQITETTPIQVTKPTRIFQRNSNKCQQPIPYSDTQS
jgi:hypothetical protein